VRSKDETVGNVRWMVRGNVRWIVRGNVRWKCEGRGASKTTEKMKKLIMVMASGLKTKK